MEEIIKRCKAGIYLSINENRDIYQTVSDKIIEANERGVGNNNSDPEIDEETAKRMIKEGMFISLQFYPDTPVGFYKVYGTSLDEVIGKAGEILF